MPDPTDPVPYRGRVRAAWFLLTSRKPVWRIRIEASA